MKKQLVYSLLPLVALLLAVGCAPSKPPSGQAVALPGSANAAATGASATVLNGTTRLPTSSISTSFASAVTTEMPAVASDAVPVETRAGTDASSGTPVDDGATTGADAGSALATGTATEVGALTPEEAAYLQKVEDLAGRLTNADELRAPDRTLLSASQAPFTGTMPDLTALNGEIAKAITFMGGIAGEVQALQPPPHLQSVQAELQAVVDNENKHLQEEQAAATAPTQQKLGLAYAGTMAPAFALLGLEIDVNERKSRHQTGMAQLAVDGPLSPVETSYVNKVEALVTRMTNAAELADATSAIGDAIDTGQQGRTLDTKAFNTTFDKALAFMDDVTAKTQALQPPPRLQALQAELLKTVADENGGLRDSQAVISTQNWANAGNLMADMSRPMTDLMTLGTDLARLGASSTSTPSH